MEKNHFKLLFCVMLLVLAVSGGKKNNIGVEAGGRTTPEGEVETHCVSVRCKSDADCDPPHRYICNRAIGFCVCSPEALYADFLAQTSKRLGKGN
ncbi:unnamed protein product [Linum tenue]|uniref:Uncharacterized protein n=1 Tax=Linum tenue TaxID=586396 RepID=A0AAV0RKQ5_9ROSI|nr:unnamed protein product [Linum tenue]